MAGSRSSAPTVSVLLPVFNGADHVERALRSVLNQTLQDFEIVVIDDGSNDATGEILRRYEGDQRITVVRKQHNEGLVAALNDGLRSCSADLVARLDADDTAHPGRLERQVALFDEDPLLVLTATAYEVVGTDGTHIRNGIPPRTHAELVLAMIGGNRISHPSVMYRASAVLRVGGYDPDWFPIEDYDLWFRLLAHGRYVGLDDVLLTYESRPSSISGQRHDDQVELQAERSAQQITATIGNEALQDSAVVVARGGSRSLRSDLAALGVLDHYVDEVRRDLVHRGIELDGFGRQQRMERLRVLSQRSRIVRQSVARLLRVAPGRGSSSSLRAHDV